MVMIMVIHVFMSSWVTKTKVVLVTDAMTASLHVWQHGASPYTIGIDSKIGV